MLFIPPLIPCYKGKETVTRLLPSRTVRAVFSHTALHRMSPAGREDRIIWRGISVVRHRG